MEGKTFNPEADSMTDIRARTTVDSGLDHRVTAIAIKVKRVLPGQSVIHFDPENL